jgi:hypothetical protein
MHFEPGRPPSPVPAGVRAPNPELLSMCRCPTVLHLTGTIRLDGNCRELAYLFQRSFVCSSCCQEEMSFADSRMQIFSGPRSGARVLFPTRRSFSPGGYGWIRADSSCHWEPSGGPV